MPFFGIADWPQVKRGLTFLMVGVNVLDVGFSRKIGWLHVLRTLRWGNFLVQMRSGHLHALRV